jgi:hypothetical protein
VRNRSGKDTGRGAGMPRWPLIFIALPAAVAIWSGWVGLGGLCGFGPVNLLPGITDATLNTAITLPVGVETYAAYALAVWLWPEAPKGAKRFAGWSALGALVYGMLGQVAYHLLVSHGYARAPVAVVVLVSCMPVAVLGLAASLTHMLRAPQEDDERSRGAVDASIPRGSPATGVSAGVSAQRPAGYKPPPQRAIMTSLGVGQGKARQFQRLLVSEVKANGNGHGGTDEHR